MSEIISIRKKPPSNPYRVKYYDIQKYCKACHRSCNQVQWYKHYKTKKHKKNLEKIFLKTKNVKYGGKYQESPL